MRCGAVRCDAVRCGAMRYDAVRCGAVRCDAIRVHEREGASGDVRVRGVAAVVSLTSMSDDASNCMQGMLTGERRGGHRGVSDIAILCAELGYRVHDDAAEKQWLRARLDTIEHVRKILQVSVIGSLFVGSWFGSLVRQFVSSCGVAC